jgi:hypothetical protein
MTSDPILTLSQAHGRLGATYCFIENNKTTKGRLVFSSIGRDGRWNRYKVNTESWTFEKLYSSKFTEGSLEKVRLFKII